MSWRKGLQRLLRRLAGSSKGSADDGRTPKEKEGPLLTGDVARDVRCLEEAFDRTTELVVRQFSDGRGRPAAVVFIDGLVFTPAIAEYIVQPLLQEDGTATPSSADEQTVSGLHDAIRSLNYGKCVLLRQGRPPTAYDVHQWAKRAVSRSEIEPTEIGSQEGFVEDLFTNIVLVRRRLRSEKLQTERMELGKTAPTDVRLVYVGGVVREALVEEVRGRVEEIDIDFLTGPNVLEEMTSDAPWSPFPNTVLTSRPDRVAGMLMEGHVAVFVDGSPMVMVAPGSWGALFQAADDYYDHYYVASFTRLVRWLAAFIGLLASALYVAVISYHHEIIPSRLLFTIASGREGVPFPPVVEAFIMELAFELLREAGLRVPSQIGQAVSIVGVLVIGDAAVRAGLVSPLMIVVVGMTAISTFAVPSNQLSNALRLLRFPLIIFAGVLGLFGVFFGVLLLTAVLLASRSFGLPYTSPFVPLWGRGLADGMVRAPMWMQRHRPWQLVNPDRVVEQPPGQYPRPEPEETEKEDDPQ